MFLLKTAWIPKGVAKTTTNTTQPEEKISCLQTNKNQFVLKLLNKLVRPNKTLGSYA